MRACVLMDVGKLAVREVPDPELSAWDVLVEVSAVGLCGTDVHIFEGHANYNADERGNPIPLRTEPQILGHEITGTVVEAGEFVRDLVAGDRVILDQGLSCESQRREPRCEYCESGDSHQCEHYREHGITGLPGGLAELISIPAVNAVRIDSDLEPAQAALSEPLGCVIHASESVRRAEKRYHLDAEAPEHRVRSILIAGAGPAGLLFLQYLRNVVRFAGTILVSELEPIKRSLAERFGAKAIDPGAEDLVSVIREETGGRGVELLIEATGSGRVFASIPGLIRKQAMVLLYGHGHAGVDLSVLNAVMFREPVLVTPVGASGGFDSDRRPSVYRRALRFIEEGTIDVASIRSHLYPSLDSVPQALSSGVHQPDYIKGVVTL